jgi:hypothetical protein
MADGTGSHVLQGALLRTDLGTHQLSGGLRRVGRFSPSLVEKGISHLSSSIEAVVLHIVRASAYPSVIAQIDVYLLWVPYRCHVRPKDAVSGT